MSEYEIDPPISDRVNATNYDIEDILKVIDEDIEDVEDESDES